MVGYKEEVTAKIHYVAGHKCITSIGENSNLCYFRLSKSISLMYLRQYLKIMGIALTIKHHVNY